MMFHPHAQKAKTEKVDPYATDKKSDWQGTPEKFPPVLVHNQEQEEEHASRGYISRGKSDASAFKDAWTELPEPDYEPEQYPKWVNGVLVNNEEEEFELLGPEMPAAEPVKRGRPAKRPAASVVTSLSNTSVTVTGASTTGYIQLTGY